MNSEPHCVRDWSGILCERNGKWDSGTGYGIRERGMGFGNGEWDLGTGNGNLGTRIGSENWERGEMKRAKIERKARRR